jgi:hypothetical protein
MACEQPALLREGVGACKQHVYVFMPWIKKFDQKKYLRIHKTVMPEPTVAREVCIALPSGLVTK